MIDKTLYFDVKVFLAAQGLCAWACSLLGQMDQKIRVEKTEL